MDAKKAWVLDCVSGLTTRCGVRGERSIEGYGSRVNERGWLSGREWEGRGKEGLDE